MAKLAAYLGLERSSVSGLIDRAVKRGLVRRDASEDDGRAVRVSLTPDGQRLASAGAAEVGELLAPMTRNLSQGEQKRLKNGIDVNVYKVSIEISPAANQAYTLLLANSAAKSVAKSWGLVVRSPST